MTPPVLRWQVVHHHDGMSHLLEAKLHEAQNHGKAVHTNKEVSRPAAAAQTVALRPRAIAGRGPAAVTRARARPPQVHMAEHMMANNMLAALHKSDTGSPRPADDSTRTGDDSSAGADEEPEEKKPKKKKAIDIASIAAMNIMASRKLTMQGVGKMATKSDARLVKRKKQRPVAEPDCTQFETRAARGTGMRGVGLRE